MCITINEDYLSAKSVLCETRSVELEGQLHVRRMTKVFFWYCFSLSAKEKLWLLKIWSSKWKLERWASPRTVSVLGNDISEWGEKSPFLWDRLTERTIVCFAVLVCFNVGITNLTRQCNCSNHKIHWRQIQRA